jgi:hypothetical protein
MKIADCCEHLHLFADEHVFEQEADIEITEADPAGSGTVTFTHPARSIVFAPKEKRSLLWIKDAQCADGAFVTFDDDGVHLHITELKSTLNFGKWFKAINQFCGMFLSVTSAARLMQIRDFASVTCYIAFKADRIVTSASTSPALLKAPVGTAATAPRTSWEKEEIQLPFKTTAILKKIQRDALGNATFAV